MSTVVEEARLVCADVGANNNKFINIWLYDNDEVEVEYGRIGQTSTKEVIKQKGKKAFDSKVAAKMRGKVDPKTKERCSVYTIAKTVKAGAVITKSIESGSLADIARKQIIINDPLVEKLIDRLVKENVHNITSSTNVTFNASSGTFETPLGPVTPEGITEARLQLAAILKCVLVGDYASNFMIRNANLFLRTVPQTVGRKLDLRILFPDQAAVQKQSDFLDGMEAASSLPSAANTPNVPQEQVFSVKLHLLGGADVERVRRKYRDTRKDMHICKHLDVKTVYSVEMATQRAAFQKGKTVGNIHEYWHGTRSANILSILKSGLKTSPPSTAAIAGKLFGNGIYFSDQSTKSLNYAYGYWGGGYQENCFMFLADVAMGKWFQPNSRNYNFPVPGYDSTFAEGGKSGVMNNEMIVYENNRFDITYLVEFSPGGK